MSLYRPHPATRAAVRNILSHYEFGLTLSELRRRASRGGFVAAIGEDGTNKVEELDGIVEYLLDAGLVEQRLVGRSVRYVDAVSFPAPTTTEENTETPA